MSQEVDTRFNELSWQSREILKAVYLADSHPATSSEVRARSTLWANRQITYRFDETSELDGLAEISQPPRDGGPIPAKRITLTEKGEAIAEQLVVTDDPSLESLAAEVSTLTDRIATVEQNQENRRDELSKEASGESAETVGERMDQLRYELRLVAEYLNQKYDGELTEFRDQRE